MMREASEFVSCWLTFGLGFWSFSVPCRDRTHPGNGLAVGSPAFSVGKLRQPTTRWLRQMFLSLTLGHLALLSCIQRVMPGILPVATRNEHGSGEYCQVMSASCFLRAKWPPDKCTGLLAQNAVRGTHLLKWLTASCGWQFSMFRVLSHLVYTLHLPHCAIVVTGGAHWTEAIGFYDRVCRNISGNTCCPKCILLQPLRLKSPKQ